MTYVHSRRKHRRRDDRDIKVTEGNKMKSRRISDIIVRAVFWLSCVGVLWFLASFAEVVTHNISSAKVIQGFA